MAGPNPNLLFSETLVAALADAGLQAVCIAPGSRSTPLALAFDAHPEIETFLHLDERCASFFALGLAQASGRPVALVCTSGTAALEFHPAVVEAHMAGVPLLLLTADRPPELRHSGANQTIDQVKMYGDHLLWAVDAALPEQAPPDVALRNLRTLRQDPSLRPTGCVKDPSISTSLSASRWSRRPPTDPVSKVDRELPSSTARLSRPRHSLMKWPPSFLLTSTVGSYAVLGPASPHPVWSRPWRN